MSRAFSLRTVPAVATALWAVSVGVKSNAEANRPQVRTPDGFVLRRTGGYNICRGNRPPASARYAGHGVPHRALLTNGVTIWDLNAQKPVARPMLPGEQRNRRYERSYCRLLLVLRTGRRCPTARRRRSQRKTCLRLVPADGQDARPRQAGSLWAESGWQPDFRS